MLKQTQEGVGVGRNSKKAECQVRIFREAEILFMSLPWQMLKLGIKQGGTVRLRLYREMAVDYSRVIKK
jgi:hypothetical protein